MGPTRVIFLIFPGGQLPSSTSTDVPVEIEPAGGSAYSTCWAPAPPPTMTSASPNAKVFSRFMWILPPGADLFRPAPMQA